MACLVCSARTHRGLTFEEGDATYVRPAPAPFNSWILRDWFGGTCLAAHTRFTSDSFCSRAGAGIDTPSTAVSLRPSLQKARGPSTRRSFGVWASTQRRISRRIWCP